MMRAPILHVLHAREDMAKACPGVAPWQVPSIFLAGPTLRDRRCADCKGGTYGPSMRGPKPCSRCDDQLDFRERSWRQDALKLFEGFDGLVVVPEDRGWSFAGDCDLWEKQVEWELYWLRWVSCVAFWVPRDMDRLPGLTTNVEFGLMIGRSRKRVVLGHPPGAPHTRYLDHLYQAPYFPSLADTMKEAQLIAARNL